MSLQSDELFQELCKNAAVVGYLDRYLAALEPEEEAKLHYAAEAALFDAAKHPDACIRYGRLELVRQLRFKLQQYTR